MNIVKVGEKEKIGICFNSEKYILHRCMRKKADKLNGEEKYIEIFLDGNCPDTNYIKLGNIKTDKELEEVFLNIKNQLEDKPME